MWRLWRVFPKSSDRRWKDADGNRYLYRKITEESAFADLSRQVMFERIARGLSGGAQATT